MGYKKDGDGRPGGGNGKYKEDHGFGMISGSWENDHLKGAKGGKGNEQSDIISGEGGDDNINGFSGDDVLVGDFYNDGEADPAVPTGAGDAGSDDITGGAGTDLLIGGHYDAYNDDAYADGNSDTFNMGGDPSADGYGVDTVRAYEVSTLEGEQLSTLGDVVNVQGVDRFDFSAALGNAVPEIGPADSMQVVDQVTAEELGSFIWVESDGTVMVDLNGNDGPGGEDDFALMEVATTADLGINGGLESDTSTGDGVTISIALDVITASYGADGTLSGTSTDTEIVTAVWDDGGWIFV